MNDQIQKPNAKINKEVLGTSIDAIINKFDSMNDVEALKRDVAILASKAGATGAKCNCGEHVAGEKVKRPLSKYQQFLSGCAKKVENGGEGKAFKECIIDWNKQKEVKK